MKIIPFNKTIRNFESRIEKIKRYAHYDKFWFDFDNDRKYCHHDYLNFKAKIFPTAYYRLNGHENVQKHILYFNIFFKLPLKFKGEHITPRKIIKSVNKTMLKSFQNKNCSTIMIDVLDIIYESFYTPKRISEFKKLKIIN